MPGALLSSRDRDEISVALIENRDASWAEIGRRIGRHRTTIMREVTTNQGRHSYRPAGADWRASQHRCRPRIHRLAEPCELRNLLGTELTQGRLPVVIVLDIDADEIAGRPCVETIYASVYAGTLGVKAGECLRMRRSRRRSRNKRSPVPVRRCRTSAIGPPRSATALSPAIGTSPRSSAPTAGPR